MRPLGNKYEQAILDVGGPAAVKPADDYGPSDILTKLHERTLTKNQLSHLQNF